MSETDQMIPLSSLAPLSPMHPLTLFIEMGKELEVEECIMDTRYESLVYSFIVSHTCATREFIEALNTVSSINGMETADCKSGRMLIAYVRSKKGNECLLLKSFYSRKIQRNPADRKFHTGCPPVSLNRLPDMELHVYDGGIAWNYTQSVKGKPVKRFPCSMKDFFYYQGKENVEYSVFLALLHAWGRTYPIWKDLAEDFKNGTAYSSIPLDIIFSCGSRRELIEKRYHHSLKRNNRECIGDAIFISRAQRLVNPNELQRLYGFHCYPCFIGRRKSDMIQPLAYFLHENLKKKFPDMTYSRKNRQTGKREPFEVRKRFIEDAISDSITLKRRIPLEFRSLRAVMDWHDELAIALRNKSLPPVQIPKNSRFRYLVMPENCIRLTNRFMFAEEGNYQSNCVAGYISSVNADICSIWSMHKEDGTRNTIEIGIRTSRNHPDGYYYIEQMYGFGNTPVSDEDWDSVRNALKVQEPGRKKRLKRNMTK